MNISKLALIALLGSALMAFGCDSDSSSPGGSGGDAGAGGDGGSGGGDGGSGGDAGAGGDGGTGGTPAPTCEDTACLFCPVDTLDPTVGALFPDGLLVPITFTAVGSQLVDTTLTVDVAATSEVSGLPVSVTATVSDESGTVYSATAGGTGSFPIAVPMQTLMGTTLEINAGAGDGTVEVEGGATEVTVQMTEAVFDIAVTEPISLPLRLDAGLDGDCEMLGDGVVVPLPE